MVRQTAQRALKGMFLYETEGISTFVSWLPAQVMPKTSTNFLEAAARPIPAIHRQLQGSALPPGNHKALALLLTETVASPGQPSCPATNKEGQLHGRFDMPLGTL